MHVEGLRARNESKRMVLVHHSSLKHLRPFTPPPCFNLKQKGGLDYHLSIETPSDLVEKYPSGYPFFNGNVAKCHANIYIYQYPETFINNIIISNFEVVRRDAKNLASNRIFNGKFSEITYVSGGSSM